jgi:SAM-dependent methyltransferase
VRTIEDVPLPCIDRLTPEAGLALISRLRELAIDKVFIRSLTQGPDDLRGPLHPTRTALLSGDPRAIAIRLFFCGAPVDQAELGALLGSGLAGKLAAAGLLIESSPGLWTFPFQLRLVCGLFLVSDFLGDARDAVMGAGETTGILYQAALPRCRVGRVLDLGCGAGTLALLLAREADEVIATDINPRAVGLAQFNTAINEIRNVECRVSDLFDAVHGERFDLIVSQPPYYPNGVGGRPGETHTFLHGGVRGDELARRIVDAIPQHLLPSGRGVVFASWLADSPISRPPAHHVLELATTRQEPHGERQTVRVIDDARGDTGWFARFTVPADCWGDVHSWRIDQLIAAENLARGPDRELLQASLTMPDGSARFEEGSQLFLRCPAESLIGFAPIDETTWELLANIGAGVPAGRLEEVRAALRRGLLIIKRCL